MEIQIDDKHILIDNVGLNIQYDTVLEGQKIKVDELYDISKSEKDSLFILAEKVLNKKSYVVETLSCYAGQEFSLQVRTSDDTLNFQESSIKSWRRIMPELEEIHKIIKQETEFQD